MPHQCLNCGQLIPKGSDDILKGCSACGGKKFMFVDKPLPAPRREELKRKADEVRDEILRKADKDLLEVLKNRGIGTFKDREFERDEDLGDDWVRFRPRVDEAKEPPAEPPSGKKPSARDLISRFDEELEERGVVTKFDGPGKKKKRSKRPERKFEKVKQKEREDHLDVINIVETGVYEIDLESLLDDSPIVVQKDGSYLIHLPSLFDSGKKKRK